MKTSQYTVISLKIIPNKKYIPLFGMIFISFIFVCLFSQDTKFLVFLTISSAVLSASIGVFMTLLFEDYEKRKKAELIKERLYFILNTNLKILLENIFIYINIHLRINPDYSINYEEINEILKNNKISTQINIKDSFFTLINRAFNNNNINSDLINLLKNGFKSAYLEIEMENLWDIYLLNKNLFTEINCLDSLIFTSEFDCILQDKLKNFFSKYKYFQTDARSDKIILCKPLHEMRELLFNLIDSMIDILIFINKKEFYFESIQRQN